VPRRTEPHGDLTASLRRRAAFAAAALLLLGFALRALGILTIPPGLSGDEAINGSDALNVWRWGHTPIFFTNNYGREAGFLYLMALTIRLIGANALAIRLPAVLCGTLALALTYILLCRLWNPRVALIATAQVAVSLWPVFESRIGLRAISMVPLQALALYALWRGLTAQPKDHPSPWVWWIVLGVSTGLLPYTYIPGRIFVVVAVGWLLAIYLLSDRNGSASGRHLPLRRPPWFGLLLALGLALTVFAPFGWFILQYPEQANQRVNELSSLLDRARAGDLLPLLTNGLKTLQMFTLRGDQYWRYNVADRSLFDWVTGAFFYLGVALSFVRLRQPRHQLLLIWTGVMLLPSALASGTPSFLRSTGAMIPIYAFPAVAADAAIARALRAVRRRWPQSGSLAARAIYTALALGLMAFAAGEVIAYFIVWPNSPRVREIYTAGLAQVGRHLNAAADAPLPPTILVGADFATDYARDMVAFQTHYDGPIRWLTGRSALVVPGVDETPGELLYLFADAEPPAGIAGPILERAERLSFTTSSDGSYESSAYLLAPDTRPSPPWEPQDRLAGRFEGAMELVGYDLPATVARGGQIDLLVVWRVPETYVVDRTAPLWFAVELHDDHGNVWDRRANLLPYAAWEWYPGDWVAHQISIPVAVDLPPGELTISYSIQREQTPLAFIAADGTAAPSVPLGPVVATGHPAGAPSQGALPQGEASEIVLENALIVGVAMPGDPLRATLFWRAVAQPAADYRVQLSLLAADCTGAPRHTVVLPLWEGHYPTSWWRSGEAVRSFHDPRLPRDLEPGHYAVAVDLVTAEYTPSVGTTCYPLEITGYVRQFSAPEMDVRVDRPLSDGIVLLGYSLTPSPEELQPGDLLNLNLYWQAQAEPSRAYTAFAHLYEADGRILAQHDGPPCEGRCPSHAWVTGEVLTDRHVLTLPEGSERCVTSGGCNLGVGMYDLPTLTRLAIPDSDDDLLRFPWP